MISKIYLLLNLLITSIFTLHNLKVYTKLLGERIQEKNKEKNIPKFTMYAIEITVKKILDEEKEKEIFHLTQYTAENINEMISLKEMGGLGIHLEKVPANKIPEGHENEFPFSMTVGEEIAYKIDANHFFVKSFALNPIDTVLFKKPSGCMLCSRFYVTKLAFVINDSYSLDSFKEDIIFKTYPGENKEISLEDKKMLI